MLGTIAGHCRARVSKQPRSALTELIVPSNLTSSHATHNKTSQVSSHLGSVYELRVCEA